MADLRGTSIDRPQSKVDDALLQFNEGLDSLGNTIGRLEDQLSPVTNDHPQPSSGEGMTEDTKPSGDSAVLARLYGFNSILRTQTMRITSLMTKLDV